jgi:hypothetical protein
MSRRPRRQRPARPCCWLLLAASLALACSTSQPTGDGASSGGDATGPPAAGTPQWSQSGFGPGKSGRSPYRGPTTQKLKWIHILDGGWGTDVAVGSDGTAYFSRNLENAQLLPPSAKDKVKSRLLALGPNGTVRWELQGDSFSAPVLARDGTLYVSSHDNGASQLLALAADGSERWRHPIDGDLNTELVVGDGGAIYFGTQTGEGDWQARTARLHAISAAGREIWTVKLSDAGYVSTPAVTGETIYVGGDALRALARVDGSVKWSLPLQTLTGSFGPAVSPDGTIYVAGTDWDLATADAFYAVNPDGTERWRLATGLLEMTPAAGSDGTVYFHAWPHPDPAVLSSGLFAVSPDGKVKWSLKDFIKVDAGDPDVSSPLVGSDSSPIVDADGVIYMGADSGDLTAINPDGTLRWQVNLGFELDSRPSLSADGTLFICNAGGPGHTKCFAVSDQGSLDLPSDPWEGFEGGDDDRIDPPRGDGGAGCEVSGEYGVPCDTAPKCSSGEWIDGCCIAGTCQ